MWKIWHKEIPSDKSIKDGIGAKLRSCHTTMKKMKQKSAHITLPLTSEGEDRGNNSGYEERNVHQEDRADGVDNDFSEENEDNGGSLPSSRVAEGASTPSDFFSEASQ